MIFNLAYLGQAGPAAILRQLVGWTFQLLMAAIFVRVIVSWLGGLRYAKWLRPVYALTDWLVIPIQRRCRRSACSTSARSSPTSS